MEHERIKKKTEVPATEEDTEGNVKTEPGIWTLFQPQAGHKDNVSNVSSDKDFCMLSTQARY